MKSFWNGFINFCLLLVGIRFAYLGFISIIHFNANFKIQDVPSRIDGYSIGYKFGFVIGYFIRIPAAIAFLYLFIERVFKKSKSK